MRGGWIRRVLDPALAVLAALAIAVALWRLEAATRGLVVERVVIGHTPASVYRPAQRTDAPAIVIAHGFAGSRQLMQSFAVTLARNGYVAVSFDFAGHGRNPRPLGGSIVDEDGATRTLVEETTRVADYARILGNGRLALLGHSMASDIVVRAARELPAVEAVVAVSMFSPAVSAREPENLLVVVGALEAGLKEEALRAVGLAAESVGEGTGEATAVEGVTYGDIAAGTARRAVFADGVEHVGVLYSRETLEETVAWLDATFGVERAGDPTIDRRGAMILLLFAGVVAAARPLSRLLPKAAPAPVGAGLPWRRLWIVLVVPALATPLLLRILPTTFLPVLVADYLAAHFLLYGLITAACLVLARRRGWTTPDPRPFPGRLAFATAALVAYGFAGIVWPLDSYVTSFVPGPQRTVLIGVMLAGTLPFFLADEWATRGAGAARFGYAAAKLAFVLSLALAVALNLERLFFLVIIVPVIGAFFLVYGLLSRWAYRATDHPAVAALANAVAFAWALGVTFPLLAG